MKRIKKQKQFYNAFYEAIRFTNHQPTQYSSATHKRLNIQHGIHGTIHHTYNFYALLLQNNNKQKKLYIKHGRKEVKEESKKYSRELLHFQCVFLCSMHIWSTELCTHFIVTFSLSLFRYYCSLIGVLSLALFGDDRTIASYTHAHH